MKKILFITLILVSFLFGGSLLLFTNEVLFQSRESKTAELGAVFNKISWIKGSEKDVWMMNQSHYGKNAPANKWERIIIVVDKTKTPKVASFYQIKPGALEWNEALLKKRVDYRASCFLCHNNGPRAIRADEEKLSIRERATIFLWNLRIKTYGRVVYNPIHDEDDKKARVVFRHHKDKDNDKLQVKTCLVCHSESGFLSRGLLSRQQRGTIKFLVNNGDMPPKGFSLGENEKNELRDFLRGF